MKKHHEESKVVAAYVEPGKNVTPEETEAFREEQRRAEDQARIDSLKQINRNKVAQMLGAQTFIHDWTHPCLYNPETKRQSSISEYYPGLNIAIDKFFHYDNWEMTLCDFKKKALKKEGIKYVVLTPDKDMADLIAELETQE